MMQRSRLRHGRGFTLLELTVVLVVIALIAAGGIKYYQDLMQEARRSSVQILAHRFTSAVALVHAQWILQGGSSRGVAGMLVDVDGVGVYVNERGWPANTDGGSARSNDQTAAECLQLWQALLQNPAPASVGGRAPAASEKHHRFHITELDGRTCRYQMLAPKEQYFFDYHLTTGQVFIQAPPLQTITKGGGQEQIE